MNRLKAIITSSPIIISLIYIIIGTVWIQYSDQFLLATFEDPELLTQAQSNKGFLFVTISGLLIFLLIKKNNDYLGRAIRKFQESRDKFEATFEQAPIGVAHHQPNEKWIQVNQTLCDILGYKKDELLQLEFEDFIHPDDIKKSREKDQKLISGEIERYSTDKRYKRKDGSYITGHLIKSAAFDGNSHYLIATIEDITLQKEAEFKLKESLKEKEILLAEIQHRVRNNLALISALFELQTMYTENEQADSILESSKSRIKCLSLIHETFSDNSNAADINFGNCLLQLINFACSHQAADIKKEIPQVYLNINQAIPLSLICNELLLLTRNGAVEGTQRISEITLQEESQQIFLRFLIHGVQLLEEEDLEKPSRLEHVLIKTLASQIKGRIKLNKNLQENSLELSFLKKNLKGPGSSMRT